MKKTVYCLIAVLFVQCKEIYLPRDISTHTGTLVVEGFINYNGPTTITLTRSNALTERAIIAEKSALVIVEGEDGSEYPAIEKDSGHYVTDPIPINAAVGYRLNIRTAGNKEYNSDFRKLIITPAIDSISWKRQNGVEIFVNAHDPADNTQYYKWEFEETWEFKSRYKTNIKKPYTILPSGEYQFTTLEYFKPIYNYFQTAVPYNDSMYTCWKSASSSGILIGTTSKLTENRVYNPLTTIPENDGKISYLYSINISQYGISKEGYDFYNKMKKNTESLGSVFDAQPSEIRGNIICSSDTSELVLGFIEVLSKQEKRKFINIQELPGWYYQQQCENPEYPFPTRVENNPDSMRRAGVGRLFLPVMTDIESVDTVFPFKIFWARLADKYCVDCTLTGTNIKPVFWP